MFFIREYFHERAQEEWIDDVVNDHKGHDDIYVCIDLQYDFKGYG